MAHRTRIGHISVALAIVAASCSGGTSESPQEASSTTTVPASSTTSTTVAAGTLTLDVSEGELRFLEVVREQIGPLSLDDAQFILQLGYLTCDQMRAYAANDRSITDFVVELAESRAEALASAPESVEAVRIDEVLDVVVPNAPFDLCPELIDWAVTATP